MAQANAMYEPPRSLEVAQANGNANDYVLLRNDNVSHARPLSTVSSFSFTYLSCRFGSLPYVKFIRFDLRAPLHRSLTIVRASVVHHGSMHHATMHDQLCAMIEYCPLN